MAQADEGTHSFPAIGVRGRMDIDLVILLVLAGSAMLGVAFTVVPVLPGGIFPLAGMVVLGAVEGWHAIPAWAWAVQAAMLLAYLLVDNVAQLLGVRRLGASRRAMALGALGVALGPLALAPVLGPIALLAGPPIGALVGTLLGERSARRRGGTAAPTSTEYRQLGIGALVAFVVGTVAKLGVIALQVAVLAVVAL